MDREHCLNKGPLLWIVGAEGKRRYYQNSVLQTMSLKRVHMATAEGITTGGCVFAPRAIGCERGKKSMRG